MAGLWQSSREFATAELKEARLLRAADALSVPAKEGDRASTAAAYERAYDEVHARCILHVARLLLLRGSLQPADGLASAAAAAVVERALQLAFRQVSAATASGAAAQLRPIDHAAFAVLARELPSVARVATAERTAALLRTIVALAVASTPPADAAPHTPHGLLALAAFYEVCDHNENEEGCVPKTASGLPRSSRAS